jgi:CheY-like chemotaxis protein
LQKGAIVISASPAEAPARRRLTILVVEDEILVRLLVTEELREQGYTVVEAVSCDEAL